METVEQYRGFAEACRRLAATLTDRKDKQALELMALGWDKVADQHEAALKKKPSGEPKKGR